MVVIKFFIIKFLIAQIAEGFMKQIKLSVKISRLILQAAVLVPSGCFSALVKDDTLQDSAETLIVPVPNGWMTLLWL
jgi:hypothetical protein